MNVANSVIRCVAPFVGALIAAMAFSFQVDTINSLPPPPGPTRTDSEVKEGVQFQEMILANMTQGSFNHSADPVPLLNSTKPAEGIEQFKSVEELK